MIRSVGTGSAVWSTLLFLTLTGGASAQQSGLAEAEQTSPEAGPPRWEWGADVMLARPTGAFAEYVGEGTGFTVFGVRYVDRRRRVGLRLDAEVISYGSRTVRVPLSPSVPFVDVDVTTDNSIVSFALGPQVLFGGGPVRPYLRGAIGVSEFVTTTSVRSSGAVTPGALPFASTENFDDHTFLATAGGGLRWTLSRESRHPIGLQVGGVLTWHGMTSYLREGSISEGLNGETVVAPIRSETNLATLHFGITVGAR